VSWRRYSAFAGLVAVVLVSGCATQPRSTDVASDEQAETISGPSTLIAGAKVDEVRGVAMGAARAKGWTIVSASEHKVVLSRSVNPDAPQAVELGPSADGLPPTIEVTSLFREGQGGVSVTVNAQLVTRVQGQGKGGKGLVEQRSDYTESYRDSLTHSLDSLRSAWAALHQRVAAALPPVNAAGQAAAETAAELNSDQAGAASTGGGAPLQSPITPEPAPAAWGSAPEEEAETAAEVQEAPEPRPAPVVLATPAAARTVAPHAPTAAAAKPATGNGNMMALNQGSQTRNGMSSAERFAAKHGCNVRLGHTVLVRRDGPAEVLRVYCTGDPAFVIKCTDGACKILE
jgi:hypothetical protein